MNFFEKPWFFSVIYGKEGEVFPEIGIFGVLGQFDKILPKFVDSIH